MKLADQIRQYVRVQLIEPARVAGRRQVKVRAGDVHAALDLENRMPAVCGALDAGRFSDEARVTLVRRSGPKQGANAEWIFGL